MSSLAIRELVVEHRRQSRIRLVAQRDELAAQVEINRIETEIIKLLPVSAHHWQRSCVVEDPQVLIQVNYQSGGHQPPYLRFLYPDPERPGEWVVRSSSEDI